MENDSVPDKSPGLRLTYPVEIGGSRESREIPLVVGVIGDFGNLLDADRPPLSERRFIELSALNIRRATTARSSNVAANRLLRFAESLDPTIRIQALDLTREELATDLLRRDDRTVVFRRVYEERCGMFGGEPFAMMVADFPIARTTADMAMLREFAGIAAKAACLFIAPAAPQMFGAERWDDLPAPERLDALYASQAYADWRALRDREEARFVAVTAFADPYDVVASLLEAHAKGGLWSDAELRAHSAAQGALDAEIASALVRHGFLAGTFPISEATAVQRPRRYHQPDRNTEAQAAVCLKHILTTSRFLHAATCLSRDSIGSFITLAGMETMLNRWLGDYVNDGSRAAAGNSSTQRPLAEARFSAREVLGAPGEMEVVLDLRLNMGGIPSPFSTRLAMLTVRPF